MREDRYFVGCYKGRVQLQDGSVIWDDFLITNSEQEAWEWAIRKNMLGWWIELKTLDGEEFLYKPYKLVKDSAMVRISE